MNQLPLDTHPRLPFYIPLSRGQWAIVDEEDYEWLSQYTWHAVWNSCTRSFYARRTSRPGGRPNPEHHTSMHREILGLGHKDPRFGDHVESGRTLDNRRSNLRIATHGENARNARIYRSNTSGYKGVSFKSKLGKWAARITIDGRRIHLGYYKNVDDAGEAYSVAAHKLHGEFARIR